MKIALRGATVAFVNSPGAEDRVKLVSNAVDAAKSVGVKHLVVVSGASVASKTPSIFKAQFAAIGEQTSSTTTTSSTTDRHRQHLSTTTSFLPTATWNLVHLLGKLSHGWHCEQFTEVSSCLSFCFVSSNLPFAMLAMLATEAQL
jgi:hypothetical protein